MARSRIALDVDWIANHPWRRGPQVLLPLVGKVSDAAQLRPSELGQLGEAPARRDKMKAAVPFPPLLRTPRVLLNLSTQYVR